MKAEAVGKIPRAARRVVGGLRTRRRRAADGRPVGYQHVAASGDVADEPVPVVAEHAPDVGNGLGQRSLAHDYLRPYLAHQLVFIDHFAGPAAENEQNVERLLATVNIYIINKIEKTHRPC